MIYQFEKLDAFLDKNNFPKISGDSGYKMIKGVDFEKAYKNGSISFKEDGIYLEYDGESYRGYMFIKEPYIERYGNYPKFHLTKCKTIQGFIESGKFNTRYDWANANVNDLVDKTSKKTYKDVELNICGNCREEIFEEIDTTEDFSNLLSPEDVNSAIQVDFFGYTREQESISKKYRSKLNYECENCSLQPKSTLDRRYWHLHHVNGDKTNNDEANLKCLCILCHSTVDQRHISNFNKKTKKVSVKEFVTTYESDIQSNKLRTKNMKLFFEN